MRTLPFLLLVAAACTKPDEAPPKPEVAPKGAKVELPDPKTVNLDVPPPEGDLHNVRELQIEGTHKYLKQEIKLRGFITWDYDCVEHGGKNGEWPADWNKSKIQAEIRKDATLCHKPHFYIGDTADAAHDAVIWVADLPEKDQAPAENMPVLPKYKVGDKVIVTGVFERNSVTGMKHADGLMQYKAMEIIEPAPKAP